MENLFDKIDSFAREQIDIYGLPQNFNYEVANRKAEELALSCGGGLILQNVQLHLWTSNLERQ